jgi:hypothetical protein
MQVTRNVIVDLMPLYNSGEASHDTRALVEDYLRRDPALRQLVDANEAEEPPPAPPSDAERIAIEKTRKLLRRRQWVMAFALLCTLLPLSFGFGDLDGGFTFVMFRDMPWSRALWPVALMLWFWYVRLHRGASSAGL